MKHKSDQLYIEDVVLIPRGEYALSMGVDFPCPEKVNIIDCHFITGSYVPRFWRRRRLRFARPQVARIMRLRQIDRLLDRGNARQTAHETAHGGPDDQ